MYLRMKEGRQDKSVNNLIACNLEIEKLNTILDVNYQKFIAKGRHTILFQWLTSVFSRSVEGK